MTENINHPADDEQPDDLAELFQMYVDEVDEVIDAISDAETEARLAQLLNGTAPAADIARGLAADVADSEPCLTDEDVRFLTDTDTPLHREVVGPTYAPHLTYAERRLQTAMRDLEIARERASAARADASMANWEASVSRVRAQQDTERAEAYLAEARAHRSNAVERAGRIMAKAREEANALMARAQDELAVAMERAQQIVADANTLAEHIHVEREPQIVQQASTRRLSAAWACPSTGGDSRVALTTLEALVKLTTNLCHDSQGDQTSPEDPRALSLKSGRRPKELLQHGDDQPSRFLRALKLAAETWPSPDPAVGSGAMISQTIKPFPLETWRMRGTSDRWLRRYTCDLAPLKATPQMDAWTARLDHYACTTPSFPPFHGPGEGSLWTPFQASRYDHTIARQLIAFVAAGGRGRPNCEWGQGMLIDLGMSADVVPLVGEHLCGV
jgi:hypothetical protein